MRLILAWLAIAQVRWALADLARSHLLHEQSEEALALSEQRMAYARTLAERACLTP